MKLFKLANRFARDEDGAVTVDWVVLTAGVIGLGVVVTSSVATGTKTLGETVSTNMSTRTVATY